MFLLNFPVEHHLKQSSKLHFSKVAFLQQKIHNPKAKYLDSQGEKGKIWRPKLEIWSPIFFPTCYTDKIVLSLELSSKTAVHQLFLFVSLQSSVWIPLLEFIPTKSFLHRPSSFHSKYQ